jgi:hypothetical protein
MMARLFGRDYTRAELMRKVGATSQLGGVRLAELSEGRAKGVSVVDFNLGNGFQFTVVPDRALDVYAASYQGMSLCWHSAAGMAAPTYYEPEGLGWLRTFAGGLIVTCGLSYVGAPTLDEGEALGLHGRVANLPASSVCATGQWEGDEYVMSVSGEVREALVFGAKLSLKRRIWARLGERRFFLEDTVRNEGYEAAPLQLLYHTNLGFPLLDDGSFLLTASEVKPRDAEAAKGLAECQSFSGPIHGYAEQVFYHDMRPGADGYVRAALVNPSLWHGQPMAYYLRYRKEQLPRFVEWKMMGEGDYVVGMEPSNCGVEGRNVDRASGSLQFLQPGEEREFRLEVGILVGEEEYEQFRQALPQ